MTKLRRNLIYMKREFFLGIFSKVFFHKNFMYLITRFIESHLCSYKFEIPNLNIQNSTQICRIMWQTCTFG